MNNYLVITIGREAGSAGKTIGQMLAKELGVKCYDKELLALAAEESGYSHELFEAHDEKSTNSLLYSLVMDPYSMGYVPSTYVDMPMNHKIFLAQYETIKNLARRESCVIVGRCADYALEDYDNAVRVFVTATEEDQLKHLAEYYSTPLDKAKDLRKKINKQRANYYNYYTSKKWGKASSYDLCINSSATGYEGAVQVIRAFIEMRKKK